MRRQGRSLGPESTTIQNHSLPTTSPARASLDFPGIERPVVVCE